MFSDLVTTMIGSIILGIGVGLILSFGFLWILDRKWK